MKKRISRFLIGLTAAICTAATINSMSASALYVHLTGSAESFIKQYPLCYQDEETVYYSNWSNSDGKPVYIFKRARKPTSEVICSVPVSEIERETLLGIAQTLFDDSYVIECYKKPIYPAIKPDDSDYVYVYNLNIYDESTRAETETKADQLFAALNGNYTLYEFQYDFSHEMFTHYVGVQALCEYFYRPDGSWGTKDPETGDKLKALITEKYPDWEVRESGGEAEEVYTVRKKGVDDMFSVPLAEYLAIRNTVRKELEYYDMRLTMNPDPITYSMNVKYYIGGSGDLNTDRERTVADAVLLSRCVAEDTNTPVTDQGLKEADLDCDGLLTVNDTCQLLDLLAEWK